MNFFLDKVRHACKTAIFLSMTGVLATTYICAAERQYPTIIALGYAVPIDSAEGLTTPLVILDHESSGYFGDGTLKLQYQTVSPFASMTHRLASSFDLEYGIAATALAEGNGADIYVNGERVKQDTFNANGISLQLNGHFFPESPWRVSLQADHRKRSFGPSKFTREDYAFPENFSENKLSGVFKRVGLYHEEGELSVTYESGQRGNWSNWQLDPDAGSRKTYGRTSIVLEDRMAWSETNTTKLKLFALSGNRLDLFSNFKVGGLTSEYSVPGYFRNEFRTRSARLLKLQQEIQFAEDRILYLFADTATFEELELEYLKNAPESRSISGIGISFRYGIRDLMGLPVIVTYGEGLGVPESAKESHRRELVLVLAAGF